MNMTGQFTTQRLSMHGINLMKLTSWWSYFKILMLSYKRIDLQSNNTGFTQYQGNFL